MNFEWNALPIGRTLASRPKDSASSTVLFTSSSSPAKIYLPGALIFVSIRFSPANERSLSLFSSEQLMLIMPRGNGAACLANSAASILALTTLKAVGISQTPANVSAEISPKLCPIITSGIIPFSSSTFARAVSIAKREVCAPVNVPRFFSISLFSGSA